MKSINDISDAETTVSAWSVDRINELLDLLDQKYLLSDHNYEELRNICLDARIEKLDAAFEWNNLQIEQLQDNDAKFRAAVYTICNDARRMINLLNDASDSLEPIKGCEAHLKVGATDDDPEDICYTLFLGEELLSLNPLTMSDEQLAELFAPKDDHGLSQVFVEARQRLKISWRDLCLIHAFNLELDTQETY